MLLYTLTKSTAMIQSWSFWVEVDFCLSCCSSIFFYTIEPPNSSISLHIWHWRGCNMLCSSASALWHLVAVFEKVGLQTHVRNSFATSFPFVPNLSIYCLQVGWCTQVVTFTEYGQPQKVIRLISLLPDVARLGSPPIHFIQHGAMVPRLWTISKF